MNERDLLAELDPDGSLLRDFSGTLGLLPDPDPVLKKMGGLGLSVLDTIRADGDVRSAIEDRQSTTLLKRFQLGSRR